MKSQLKLVVFMVAMFVASAGCSGNGGATTSGGDTAAGGSGGAGGDGGTAGNASGGAGGASGDCTVNPIDPTKYVIIGFWKTTDCSGDPIAQNAFPIDDSGGCYCWPGHSGENSAKNFVCDKAAGTFAYDQSTDLVCGTFGAKKESSLTECRPDVPPTLNSKIIDMSACP